MNTYIRLTGKLYDDIFRDLRRPHPFAAERVGFVLGQITSITDDGKLILLTRYHSIRDEHYVDDPSVGARIGSEAIAWAMEAAYRGRTTRAGVYHIHLHDYDGPTGMSRTDRTEIPKLIPGFQSVSCTASHGIIILSRNHGSGWVWLPGDEEARRADSIQVIGVPVDVFDRSAAP